MDRANWCSFDGAGSALMLVKPESLTNSCGQAIMAWTTSKSPWESDREPGAMYNFRILRMPNTFVAQRLRRQPTNPLERGAVLLYAKRGDSYPSLVTSNVSRPRPTSSDPSSTSGGGTPTQAGGNLCDGLGLYQNHFRHGAYAARVAQRSMIGDFLVRCE